MEKKQKQNISKTSKKNVIQRQNIQSRINSRFTPASNPKIGIFVLIPNFAIHKKYQKKIHPFKNNHTKLLLKAEMSHN